MCRMSASHGSNDSKMQTVGYLSTGGVEKIEESEAAAVPIEVFEEQDPDPAPLPPKRSLAARLWK